MSKIQDDDRQKILNYLLAKEIDAMSTDNGDIRTIRAINFWLRTRMGKHYRVCEENHAHK